jgi:hypothetical protein
LLIAATPLPFFLLPFKKTCLSSLPHIQSPFLSSFFRPAVVVSFL